MQFFVMNLAALRLISSIGLYMHMISIYSSEKNIRLPVVQSLGLEGFFFLLWPVSVTCYLSLGFKVSSVPCTKFRLSNSKAAAHVAVDLQCWTL